MEIENLVRSLALLLELSSGASLLWIGLGSSMDRGRLGEFLLLGHLSALGVVTLWSAAIRHQNAMIPGMTLIVLLLALLHKVSRDMHRGPHFMDEAIVSSEVMPTAG